MVFCGTHQSAQDLVDLLENGQVYPPVDICVDAAAVFDPIATADLCDFVESSVKLHLISGRDRMVQGILRFLCWVDTRDMLADGLTEGGIDRTLLDNISGHCTYKCQHEPLRHSKFGRANTANTAQQKFERHTMHKPRAIRFVEGWLVTIDLPDVASVGSESNICK